MATMDVEMDTSSQVPICTPPKSTPPASADPDHISSLKPRYPVPEPEPIPTPMPPPHPPNPTTQPALEPELVSQPQPELDTEPEPTPEPVPEAQQAPDADSALESAPTKEDPLRPHTGRYQPSHPAYRLSRFQLRKIASTTLRRLELGYYIPPSAPSIDATAAAGTAETLSSRGVNSEVEVGGSGVVKGNDYAVEDTNEAEDPKPKSVRERYDLTSKIEWTDAHTEYWAPDAPELGGPWDFEEWGGADLDLDVEMDALVQAQSQSVSMSEDGNDESQMGTEAISNLNSKTNTKISIKECSTLVGARKLHAYLCENPPSSGNTVIGVLNFASAKKPGGGFINGAQAQEESIARTSTLYPSLISDPAAPFYLHHVENPSDAFYTHAMVYSPRVVIFRNDQGSWMRPIEVDVLTCAAVNAGEVRRQEEKERERERERAEWEEEMGRLRERVRKAEQARERRREEEERKREDLGSMGTDDVVEDEAKISAPDPELVDGLDWRITSEADVEAASASEPTVSSLPSSPAATATSTPRTTELDLQPEPELEPESVAPVGLSSPTPASSTPPPLRTPHETEHFIATTMYIRIARVLALFQYSNARHLILGSFGTGVFQNHIPVVAHIFWDLLVKEGAPFEGAFENVVFAILGSGTVRVFREVFGVAGEEDDRSEDCGDEEERREVEDMNLRFNDDVGGEGIQQDGADGASTVAGGKEVDTGGDKHFSGILIESGEIKPNSDGVQSHQGTDTDL